MSALPMAELPSSGNFRQLSATSSSICASSSFHSAPPADHKRPSEQIPTRSYSDICYRSFDFPSPPVAAFQNDSTAPDQSRRPPGSWSLRSLDPEIKRKRRLAGYKVMSLEGMVKSSVRKSFRWLKDKYVGVVNRTDICEILPEAAARPVCLEKTIRDSFHPGPIVVEKTSQLRR